MKGFNLAVFALACLLTAAGAARGQAAGQTQTRGAGAAQTPQADEGLARLLARVGEAVERYQRGLFSIRFTETVRREELKEDLTPKHSKEYVYESVTTRESLSDAEGDYFVSTVSHLKAVDGKPAKAAGKDSTKSDSAKESAPNHEDFLNFLLPKFQSFYRFSFEGEELLRGRRTFRVGAERPGDEQPRVEWEGGSFVAFAPTRMAVWVDAETGDVLQIESRLVRPFEFDSPRGAVAGPFGRFSPSRRLRYERDDYSVRFRPVHFKDPDQTLLLPEYAEWLWVIEGARRPRTRVTISFTNYQRFVSDVKVIEDPDE
ncbi:MAG TPA: hypothetical protein VE713_06965 [Pyrinomonadaceae bacterium]|nr:hypothetical protein [Pyrinomonadaceae bacterium]